MALNRTQVTVLLGIAQTLSWASSYYLLAVLAKPISQSTSTSYSLVFGAFSAALLVAAAVGPIAGRLIDRFGGRSVLLASNLVFACGLLMLSQATQTLHIFVAWALMGVAMGSGLYEAAFASVVHLYGQDARPAITGITLFAGFASTVGWPLSSYLEGLYDWRAVCMFWAALHLLLGLPLNALLSRAKPNPREVFEEQKPPGAVPEGASNAGISLKRTAYLMAYVFAASWFISTAMASHLPQILQASGATLAASIAAAALVGPAQVAGRLVEYSFLKKAHPLLSARLAILAHPLAAVCLGLAGASAASVFAILHGLGNGILTIAIGTLPLKVFGSQGYGQRQGWLMVPARIVQAGSPFLFGLAVANWGSQALWLSSVLAISAFAALWSMRVSAQQ
ncbi:MULTISPECIES: MFS transporter [unclassified Comamonas]|uniref:MFS transporter n=1 Tax=unclassified Comamonas TaxID=2638500 RepID=UPI000C18DED5|nr:MFS transporter [Comamonas sp. 26]PIG08913.1 putative MFS family arabinose efflux permease [Comamonas sp. 26]